MINSDNIQWQLWFFSFGAQRDRIPVLSCRIITEQNAGKFLSTAARKCLKFVKTFMSLLFFLITCINFLLEIESPEFEVEYCRNTSDRESRHIFFPDEGQVSIWRMAIRPLTLTAGFSKGLLYSKTRLLLGLINKIAPWSKQTPKGYCYS